MKALFVLLGVLLAVPVWAQQEIVAAERAKLGVLVSPAEAPALLTAIARHLPGGPWGLLVKTDGNNCGGFACDIVCNAAEHFDVLIDSPDAAEHYSGTARPAWQPKGPYAPRACAFVAPEIPVPIPVPGPVPQPPVPSCDLSSLYAQLSVLNVTCAALKAGQDDHAAKFAEHAQSEEQHWQNVKGFWEKHGMKVLTSTITGVITGVITWWQTRDNKAK